MGLPFTSCYPSELSTAMERLKTNLELCVFFSLLVCPSWSNSMRMHGLAEYVEPNCTLVCGYTNPFLFC
jgi:hypothetical protein